MKIKTPASLDLYALVLIIAAGAAMLFLWSLNPEFRTLYVGEPFVDANQFIPGANFKELGFWELRFTADYAVGPKECHPFYYTHNPPLSEVLNGLYQRLGLVRIEWQRLVCMVWTLLALLFFYATLKLVVGQTVAFLALLITVTNPHILYWGDNLFGSHQLMFVFMTLYFFVRLVRSPAAVFYWLSWTAFLCASLSNYELIPMIAVFIAGLWILHIDRYPRRLFSIYSAPLVAFCLRNALIVWAIGFHGWFNDMMAILFQRTVGMKTAFSGVYNHLPIILWERDPELPRHYLWLLYSRLEQIYGYGWGVLLLSLLFPAVRRNLLPEGPGRPARTIALFFAMGIAWYVLFPQHTSAHFHSLPMLFLLPFAGVLWAMVVIGSFQKKRPLMFRVSIVVVAFSCITAARIINFRVPKEFPGIRALRRYENRVFCTNAIPTLVEYYTRAPAAFCGYPEQFRGLLEGRYYFFLRTDRCPAPVPEYFFSVFGDFDYLVSQYFPLVERGPGYAIYRLQPAADSKVTIAGKE